MTYRDAPAGIEWPTRDPLSHRVAATPERTAIVAPDGRSWTYRDLDAAVDGTAAGLASMGVGPGDRVGVLMDTRVAFAVVLFGASRRGASVVPLNVRLTAESLGDRIERTDPPALVCEADTEATARDVAGDRRVRSVGEPGRGEVRPLEDAPTVGKPEPEPLAPGDEALVMFTSGTTGRPKGVRLTVGNLLASAAASAFRLGVAPDDRWLCCLPMYHMGGLAPVVRSTLYGTAAVVQREFGPESTARVLEQHGITGVSLVPTMLGRLLDAGWKPPDSLRFALLGGAPAPQGLIERCADRGVPVCPTYGMTETASQAATARPGEAFEHPGTVGQPLVTTGVTVVDESGERCGPGETGELVASGPTVTPGYLEEGTTAAFGDRGFHTGDAGYRDGDGRLWILNRLDDRIVTGGENVDPGEVTGVLRGHPAVREVAVVGIDDPEWGERVAALVVPGGDVDADDLEAHCRERLGGFKIPRTIAFAGTLPRTASGTVDREGVRRAIRGRTDD